MKQTKEDQFIAESYFKVYSESPQTMPAPVKPSTPTKPDTPSKPAKPADPFFPKPGIQPRPKAGNRSLNRFIGKRTRYKK